MDVWPYAAIWFLVGSVVTAFLLLFPLVLSIKADLRRLTEVVTTLSRRA